jgi:hypothetical protein
MNRVTLALLVLTIPARSAWAQEAGDDASALAKEALDRGAAMVAEKDAKGLAESYTKDAELVLVSKAAARSSTDVRQGRAAIEEFYRSAFAGDHKETFRDIAELKPRNTVEYARYLDPHMMLICGVFEPNAEKGPKLRFIQVRVRQDDRWQISSLKLFALYKD